MHEVICHSYRGPATDEETRGTSQVRPWARELMSQLKEEEIGYGRTERSKEANHMG